MRFKRPFDMPNDHQAQADIPSPPQTVADPLDVANSPNNGTSGLADYEATVAALLQEAAPPIEPGELPADLDDGDLQAGDDIQPDDEPPEEFSDPDDETPVETPGGKTTMRPRFKDPVDIAIAAIAKAQGVNLIEATRIYEQGTTKLTSPEQDNQEAPRETFATVTEQIKALREQKKEALAALEFESVSDLEDQIDALQDKRVELRQQEAVEKSRADTQAETAHNDAYAKSERIAIAHYPDCTDPNSALTKRVAEMDRRMLDLGDPLYHHPDKPRILVTRAAVELGIPMSDPKAAPRRQTNSSRSPIQPASGNARTTAPATLSSKLDQIVASAVDESSYEKALDQLLAR